MVRVVEIPPRIRFLGTLSVLFATTILSTACGNSGSITFRPESSVRTPRGISVTQVPASQALAVEDGFTPATGHTAKLQINPVKGTVLTGGGYTVKMKHTVRNR